MKTIKLPCLLLIALLTASFFAASAAAYSACPEWSCACAPSRQATCELKQRQNSELTLFTAGRLDSFQKVIFAPARDHFDWAPRRSERIPVSAAGAVVPSTPIYLKIQTLIC